MESEAARRAAVVLRRIAVRLTRVDAAVFDAVLTQVVADLVDLDGDRALLVELTDGGRNAVIATSWPPSADVELAPNTLPSIVSQLISGESVVVDDDHSIGDLFAADEAEFESFGLGAMLAVPVWRGGVVVGGLVLITAKSYAWSPETVAALDTIAQLVSGAAERVGDERKHLAMERERILLGRSSDVVLVVDDHGIIGSAGSAVSRVLGRSAESVRGLSFIDDLVHPDDVPATLFGLGSAQRSTDRPVVLELRLQRGDGSWCDVEATIDDLTADLVVQGVVVTCRDVSERKAADDASRRDQHRLNELLDHVSDVVLVVSRSGLVLFANAALKRVCGFNPDVIVGSDLSLLVHPDDLELAARELPGVGEDATRAVDLRMHHADGSWRTLEVRGTDRLVNDPAVAGVVLSCRDVTENRETARRLREAVERDPLTGLLSRAGIEHVLTSVLSGDEPRPAAVLFCDLDGLKRINDTYGHEVGDRMLQRFGERLVHAVRPTDAVGRLGGDEFVIVCPGVADTLGARLVSTRVLASLAGPADLIVAQKVLAASIGVALVEAGTSPDDAIARADAAMYRAKRAGGARFVLETDEPERSTAMVDLLQEEHDQSVAALLHRLTRGTSDVVMRVMLGEVNAVELVSDAVVELTGHTRAELVGMAVHEFIDARDLVMLRSLLEPAPPRIEAVRLRLRKADGTDVWCELSGLPILDSLGHAIGIEAIARDATDWIAMQHRLNDQALHDPLTLLPTRELFLVKSRDVLVHRATDENTVALLSIDLDGLDEINTALGRVAGDEVVRLVAERVQQAVARTDLVGRVGGDEFAVLLTSASGPGEAVATASRMCAALAHPLRLRSTGEEVYVSASVGLAMAAGPGDDPRQLVRDAGFALQRAKAQGAGTWEVFDAEMRRGLDERFEIERDLRRALERNELRVHYQPEVLFATGEIIGAEALIRWQHPSRGLLGAMAFVDVAEETGIIVPIGWWVLRQATQQAVEWHDAGHDVVVRVNLSARQITHPDLVFEVSSALTESGVRPEKICLEITETVLMNEPGAALDKLMELKELGVHLAIDDFGTGYSSLAYLKKFPVDVLKIDKSFVDGIAIDPQDRAIVSTIVSLTQSLQLEVTAEGVETEDQAGELVVLGCRRGQGFLFSKPVPPEDIQFTPVPRPDR